MTPDHQAASKSLVYRARDALQAGGAVGIGTLLVMLYGLQAKVQDSSDAIAAQTAVITVMQQSLERIQTVQRFDADAFAAHVQAAQARWDTCEQRIRNFQRDIEDVNRQLRENQTRLQRLEGLRMDSQGMRAPDRQGRIAQLVAAIRALDPADHTAWTAETPPRPTTRALALATGTPVASGERDAAVAAWLLIQPDLARSADQSAE